MLVPVARNCGGPPRYSKAGIVLVFVFVITAAWTGVAHAAEKSVTWIDANYVPCEGIGATGSGEVRLHVDYTVQADKVTVTSLLLTTSYVHQHQPAATIEWTAPDGARRRFTLQRPWYSIIGSPNTGALVLPRREGGAAGPSAQTPFEMRAQTAIDLSLSVRFPQPGGSCGATFENRLVVP
jgi:ABC-type cobalt transport system substrate-binding protein